MTMADGDSVGAGEIGKRMLGRGMSMCKGFGVGIGIGRRLLWLKGVSCGKIEGDESGGIGVIRGFVGRGRLWVLF